MAMDLCPAKTRDSARMRGCGGGGGTREAGSVGTGLAGARLLQKGGKTSHARTRILQGGHLDFVVEDPRLHNAEVQEETCF